MKKEDLINADFDTQESLCAGLRKFFEFIPVGEEEKMKWPYKSELSVSLKNKEQMHILDFLKKKTYRLDYANIKYKIFIEIHGDYWHCNPLLYEKNYFHPQKEKVATEIWKLLILLKNCQV